MDYAIDQLIAFELDSAYQANVPLLPLPNTLRDMLEREKKEAAVAANKERIAQHQAAQKAAREGIASNGLEPAA